jgi:hypothetical protein
LSKILCLHIGTHKTGTTALQRFFSLNRAMLKKRGVFYPYEGGSNKPAGHYRMVYSLCTGAMPSYWLVPEDLGDERNEWVAVLNPPPEENVLLSSEFFFQCNPEVLERIRDFASGYQVKVVVYLRRQDDLEMSWYNQGVKGARREKESAASVCRYPTEACFRRWEDVFGAETMIVRPYEKGRFDGGNIFADFLLHVFGWELTKEYIIPESVSNDSLHPMALEYKRLVNHLPLRDDEIGALVTPLRRFSAHLRKAGGCEEVVLSPADRLAIIETYQPFYAEIAQKYIGREDGRLFHAPLPDVNQAWKGYEITPEDVQQIHGYLAAHFPRVLDIVVNGIQAGAACSDPQVRASADLINADGLQKKHEK